ncbi:MAG: DbpA RNA binding domain-containing protein, partial [Deltaproteobacteria bacterium]|nr:DbpA RNA binding domain-containing protein [Deltaproteobacteria bacterium]
AVPGPERRDRFAPAAGGNDDRGGRRPGRGDFAREGVMFRVNIGAKDNADPRWLLPLICRRGGVTSRDVGAIRIGPQETVFEISGDVVSDFALSSAERDPRAPHVTIEPMRGAGRPDNNQDRGARNGRVSQSRAPAPPAAHKRSTSPAPAPRPIAAAPARVPAPAPGEKPAPPAPVQVRVTTPPPPHGPKGDDKQRVDKVRVDKSRPAKSQGATPTAIAPAPISAVSPRAPQQPAPTVPHPISIFQTRTPIAGGAPATHKHSTSSERSDRPSASVPVIEKKRAARIGPNGHRSAMAAAASTGPAAPAVPNRVQGSGARTGSDRPRTDGTNPLKRTFRPGPPNKPSAGPTSGPGRPESGSFRPSSGPGRPPSDSAGAPFWKDGARKRSGAPSRHVAGDAPKGKAPRR